jgi:hypothetical protein
MRRADVRFRRAAPLVIALLAVLLHTLPAQAAPTVVRLTNNTATQGETSMAISGANENVMVVGYNDFSRINHPAGVAGYAYTTTGGASAPAWHRGLHLQGVTVADPGSLGWDRASDPVVRYSQKDDTFKYAIIGVHKTSSVLRTAIVYDSSSKTAHAPTAGLTWISPVTVGVTDDTQHNPGSPSCSGTWTDKPDMAVDNNSASPHYGRVYLAWHERNCGDSNVPVFVTHHDVGVAGWSKPVRVSSNPPFADNWGPSIRVGGTDGRVYVSWCAPISPQHCHGGGEATILVSSSSDGGASWTKPHSATGVFQLLPSSLHGGQRFANNSHPVMTVNPTNSDRVNIVFPVWNGRDSDVEFVHSADGGTTWTFPIVLGAGPHNQFLPWLSNSPGGGTLWACYYTEGYDPPLIDVACTKSTNGTSFSTPVRATTFSFDPANSSWIGDYLAASVDSNGRYRAAWSGYQACCPGANLDVYFGM